MKLSSLIIRDSLDESISLTDAILLKFSQKKHVVRQNVETQRTKCARSVNAIIGAKDGGNLNIARGHVLYASAQDARRNEILATPSSFYAESY